MESESNPVDEHALRERAALEILSQLLEKPHQERSAHARALAGSDRLLLERVDSLLESNGEELNLDASPLSLGNLFEKQRSDERLDNSVAGVRPDAILGSYRILRHIGSGGMSSVWLAERESDYQVQVAIKVVREGFLSEELRERFLRERRLLARLNHPNIARLIDGGDLEDGRPYLVMEYVDGIPIDRFCSEGKLDIRGRLRIFCQILEAVEFAHQHLVVHRDIKPGNILIQADGRPKLLDFGIAKALGTSEDEGGPPTWTGQRLMTLRYASPEQVEGGDISTGSDVYSLGVLLYELICGRSPYPDVRAGRLLRDVVELTPSRPSSVVAGLEKRELAGFGEDGTAQQLRRKLDGDLDWIALACLRKQRDRRYGTVRHLADDLRRHLRGHPVLAVPDSLGYRFRKLIQRHRTATAALAVTLVLISVSTLIAVTSGMRAVQAAEVEQNTRMDMFEAVEFLSSLLLAPAPLFGNGPETTYEEVLENACKEIAFVDNPRVRGTVQVLLSTAYSDLGNSDIALEMGLAALDSFEAGTSSIDLCLAHNNLANIHELGGRDQVAMDHLRSSLRILEGKAGDSSMVNPRRSVNSMKAITFSDLAGLMSQRGELEEALDMYHRAHALLLDDGVDPVSYNLLLIQLNQVDVLVMLGRPGEALQIATEVREQSQSGREENRIEIFDDVVYTFALTHAGHPETALEVLNSVLPAYEKRLGPNHEHTASLLYSKAIALLAMERFREAESLILRTRGILAESSNEYITLSYLLGACQVGLGLAEEGATTLRETLGWAMRRVPDDSFLRGQILRSLGSAFLAQGLAQDGQAALQEAHDLFASITDSTHPEALATDAMIEEALKP